MGIKSLITLLKIMTECDGLDIMTRADRTGTDGPNGADRADKVNRIDRNNKC